MSKIKVKPTKDMLIYDLDGSVIPAKGKEVENCRYFRKHIKDGSLIDMTKTEIKNKKKGA